MYLMGVAKDLTEFGQCFRESPIKSTVLLIAFSAFVGAGVYLDFEYGPHNRLENTDIPNQPPASSIYPQD